MKRNTAIRWEVGGIAATLILAMLNPSPTVRVLLIALGSILLLFALGLPQRVVQAALQRAAALIRRVYSEHRLIAARQHCEAVIEQLSVLLSSTSTSKLTGWDRMRSHLRFRGNHSQSPISIYEVKLLGLTIAAVEEAIKLGALDNGVSMLARSPKSATDLHELLAGLLRVVGELGTSTSREVAESLRGFST